MKNKKYKAKYLGNTLAEKYTFLAGNRHFNKQWGG
jgi:hypothetical protein